MDKHLPKPSRNQQTSSLPSREDIIAFAEREGERGVKIGKREIARAFAVKGSDRIELKRLIKDMEAEGLLDRQRKALTKTGHLPSVVVADIGGTTPDGDLFATPSEWDEEAKGAAPRILVTLPRRKKQGEPTPGARQRALAHRAPA